MPSNTIHDCPRTVSSEACGPDLIRIFDKQSVYVRIACVILLELLLDRQFSCCCRYHYFSLSTKCTKFTGAILWLLPHYTYNSTQYFTIHLFFFRIKGRSDKVADSEGERGIDQLSCFLSIISMVRQRSCAPDNRVPSSFSIVYLKDFSV